MPVGQGVGPSVVNQLFRDRSLRLATLLAVGIGIPVAILFYFQFRSMAPAQRAIAVFEAPLNGRRTYFLAQLRFTFPSRDRLTSFVAVRVDAERLRTIYIPQLVATRLAKVDGPTGFPPLNVTVL